MYSGKWVEIWIIKSKGISEFFTVVYCLASSSMQQFTGRCFCFVWSQSRSREMADNASCIVFRRRSNWQKMTTKLAKHFSWKAHKAALADFYAFGQDPSNVDMLLDKERRVNAIYSVCGVTLTMHPQRASWKVGWPRWESNPRPLRY